MAAVENHAFEPEPAAGPAAGDAQHVGVENHAAIALRPEFDGDAFVAGDALRAVEGALAFDFLFLALVVRDFRIGVEKARRQKTAVIHFLIPVRCAGGKCGEAEEGGGEEVRGIEFHGWK